MNRSASLLATTVTRRQRIPSIAGAVLLALTGLHAAPAFAQSADALRAGHESRKAAMASSPFQRPLLLDAKVADADSRGDVHAVIDHGFGAVSRALGRGAAWCDVFMLQTNVKRCVAEGASDGSAAASVRVWIARRHDDPVSSAFEVTFRFRRVSASDDYLSVGLSADAGPLGTRDYRLSLEAVPLDARRTVVHMAYSYTSGMAARVATQAYLASSGRDKVGFTVAGRDATGAPTYVGGIQGVAERNTMRYFLAIESVLDSMDQPPAQRVEARLRHFHASIEKHPRQLHELTADAYLEMKRRELRAP